MPTTKNGNGNGNSRTNPNISSQFRTLVLDRMSAAGMIPAELARRLGCTDQNVALLLTPGRDYKLSTMERIAKAIGLQFSISDLESEVRQENPERES